VKTLTVRIAAVIGFLLTLSAGQAAELHVVSSGGFTAAFRTLAPIFEQRTGDKLVIGWGPSMGDTKDAIPARLKRGERIDVVIMVGYALANLISQGKVIADSRLDLARSGIGVAVRHGVPHPDISTVDALRTTLLAAKSIAYSDSASGVYIANEMFKKLGIADQVAGKARMIPAEPNRPLERRGKGDPEDANPGPVPRWSFLGLAAAVAVAGEGGCRYRADGSAHGTETSKQRKRDDQAPHPTLPIKYCRRDLAVKARRGPALHARASPPNHTPGPQTITGPPRPASIRSGEAASLGICRLVLCRCV
jgi:molybdate transport system substrate-binding protein